MLGACGSSTSGGKPGGQGGGGVGGSTALSGGSGGSTPDAGGADVAATSDTATAADVAATSDTATAADVAATSDTATALDSDALDGGGGTGTVPQQCLAGLVNPFAAMAPDWANWSSSSCSSLAAANGSLVLTQNEPCSVASPNAIAGLAPPNVLCGDFDVQVDFAVTGLVAGVTGGIFASMRANDPTVTTNGMTIERYAAEYVVPSSQSYQNYKSYTTNKGDDATSVFVPTTDVTGRFRLTRAGTTVKSYYWKTGAPAGQWVLVNTATLTNTPWVLVLYEGDNSAANKGPTAPYSVTFSNLLVTFPGPTDAGTGIAPVADAGDSDTPDGPGMVATVATLILGDSVNNSLYRLNITPTGDPVVTAVVSTPGPASGTIVGPTGELLVGQDTQDGAILRYQSPLTALAPNGSISGVGTKYIETMALVDSELWVPNTAYAACTTESENLVRISFDNNGQATAVGTVNTNLVGANRGILWEPTSRSLYVTQCAPVNTIQHFHVAVDHSVTALAAVTGNNLNNPHAMAISPWGGELFVANAGTPANPGNAILRFAFDSEGNLTPLGSLTGNGLNIPAGVGFMPWGELVVVNNGNATISRYVFDASHTASPSRAPFAISAPTTAGSFGVGFFTVIAGASTAVADAGGT